MFRTIHHPDDAEIHLGSEGEEFREEVVEIPEKVRDPLAANKELLSQEDKVDLRVEQEDLVEILKGVREDIVEIQEEVRDPLAADKELLSLEDKVDLRVEQEDLVEIPKGVREKIVGILEKVRGPFAADKNLLSLEDKVQAVETELEAGVVRGWKQEHGKS